MVAGENLTNGSICKTLGYSNYMDGGGRYYKVREIRNTDVVDGVNIIALDVSNDLIAELIPEEFLDYIDDIKEIATKGYELVTKLNNKSTLVNAYFDAKNK